MTPPSTIGLDAGPAAVGLAVVLGFDRCPPITVQTFSNIPAVRHEATAAARAADFTEHDVARVAVVATEMATNLAKHARSGRVRVRGLQRGGARGVELVASDLGPGIADTRAARVDGFSTSDTLGGGLGAIARLSDETGLFSTPSLGTVALSRLWATGVWRPPTVPIGTIIDCAPGETVSGDGCWAAISHGQLMLLAVDGLGHGPLAHEAAQAAVECFERAGTADPSEALALVCRALASTRGAAAAVASVDFGGGRLRYCGIGNITGTILGPGHARHLVSHAGIVGQGRPRLRVYDEPLPAGARVVLASDGLRSRWEPAMSPGLLRCHPQIFASILARDHARGTDDVLVVVADGPDDVIGERPTTPFDREGES